MWLGVFIEGLYMASGIFSIKMKMNIRNLKHIYTNLCTPTCVMYIYIYREREIVMCLLSDYEIACLLRITICCALR